MILTNDNNLKQGNGFIDVYNQGAFYMYFTVQYSIGRCVYFAQTPSYPSLVRKRIIIPGNATNVYLDVQTAVWVQVWKSIYKTYFATCPYNCFRAYGYAFYPLVENILCDSSNNICNNFKI